MRFLGARAEDWDPGVTTGFRSDYRFKKGCSIPCWGNEYSLLGDAEV